MDTCSDLKCSQLHKKLWVNEKGFSKILFMVCSDGLVVINVDSENQQYSYLYEIFQNLKINIQILRFVRIKL